MNRSMKTLEDGKETKVPTNRRSRSLYQVSELPLRRSSRINKQVDHSPETHENARIPRSRHSTLDVTSDISKSTKRDIRAGSETKTMTPGRIVRKTRASSVTMTENDLQSSLSSWTVYGTPSRNKRLSMLPSQPSVAEEIQDLKGKRRKSMETPVIVIEDDISIDEPVSTSNEYIAEEINAANSKSEEPKESTKTSKFQNPKIFNDDNTSFENDVSNDCDKNKEPKSENENSLSLEVPRAQSFNLKHKSSMLLRRKQELAEKNIDADQYSSELSDESVIFLPQKPKVLMNDSLHETSLIIIKEVTAQTKISEPREISITVNKNEEDHLISSKKENLNSTEQCEDDSDVEIDFYEVSQYKKTDNISTSKIHSEKHIKDPGSCSETDGSDVDIEVCEKEIIEKDNIQSQKAIVVLEDILNRSKNTVSGNKYKTISERKSTESSIPRKRSNLSLDYANNDHIELQKDEHTGAVKDIADEGEIEKANDVLERRFQETEATSQINDQEEKIEVVAKSDDRPETNITNILNVDWNEQFDWPFLSSNYEKKKKVSEEIVKSFFDPKIKIKETLVEISQEVSSCAENDTTYIEDKEESQTETSKVQNFENPQIIVTPTKINKFMKKKLEISEIYKTPESVNETKFSEELNILSASQELTAESNANATELKCSFDDPEPCIKTIDLKQRRTENSSNSDSDSEFQNNPKELESPSSLNLAFESESENGTFNSPIKNIDNQNRQSKTKLLGENLKDENDIENVNVSSSQRKDKKKEVIVIEIEEDTVDLEIVVEDSNERSPQKLVEIKEKIVSPSKHLGLAKNSEAGQNSHGEGVHLNSKEEILKEKSPQKLIVEKKESVFPNMRLTFANNSEIEDGDDDSKEESMEEKSPQKFNKVKKKSVSPIKQLIYVKDSDLKRNSNAKVDEESSKNAYPEEKTRRMSEVQEKSVSPIKRASLTKNSKVEENSDIKDNDENSNEKYAKEKSLPKLTEVKEKSVSLTKRLSLANNSEVEENLAQKDNDENSYEECAKENSPKKLTAVKEKSVSPIKRLILANKSEVEENADIIKDNDENSNEEYATEKNPQMLTEFKEKSVSPIKRLSLANNSEVKEKSVTPIKRFCLIYNSDVENSAIKDSNENSNEECAKKKSPQKLTEVKEKSVSLTKILSLANYSNMEKNSDIIVGDENSDLNLSNESSSEKLTEVKEKSKVPMLQKETQAIKSETKSENLIATKSSNCAEEEVKKEIESKELENVDFKICNSSTLENRKSSIVAGSPQKQIEEKEEECNLEYFFNDVTVEEYNAQMTKSSSNEEGILEDNIILLDEEEAEVLETSKNKSFDDSSIQILDEENRTYKTDKIREERLSIEFMEQVSKNGNLEKAYVQTLEKSPGKRPENYMISELKMIEGSECKNSSKKSSLEIEKSNEKKSGGPVVRKIESLKEKISLSCLQKESKKQNEKLEHILVVRKPLNPLMLTVKSKPQLTQLPTELKLNLTKQLDEKIKNEKSRKKMLPSFLMNETSSEEETSVNNDVDIKYSLSGRIAQLNEDTGDESRTSETEDSDSQYGSSLTVQLGNYDLTNDSDEILQFKRIKKTIFAPKQEENAEKSSRHIKKKQQRPETLEGNEEVEVLHKKNKNQEEKEGKFKKKKVKNTNVQNEEIYIEKVKPQKRKNIIVKDKEENEEIQFEETSQIKKKKKIKSKGNELEKEEIQVEKKRQKKKLKLKEVEIEPILTEEVKSEMFKEKKIKDKNRNKEVIQFEKDNLAMIKKTKLKNKNIHVEQDKFERRKKKKLKLKDEKIEEVQLEEAQAEKRKKKKEVNNEKSSAHKEKEAEKKNSEKFIMKFKQKKNLEISESTEEILALNGEKGGKSIKNVQEKLPQFELKDPSIKKSNKSKKKGKRGQRKIEISQDLKSYLVPMESKNKKNPDLTTQENKIKKQKSKDKEQEKKIKNEKRDEGQENSIVKNEKKKSRLEKGAENVNKRGFSKVEISSDFSQKHKKLKFTNKILSKDINMPKENIRKGVKRLSQEIIDSLPDLPKPKQKVYVPSLSMFEGNEKELPNIQIEDHKLKISLKGSTSAFMSVKVERKKRIVNLRDKMLKSICRRVATFTEPRLFLTEKNL